MAYTEHGTTTSIYIPSPMDLLRKVLKWNAQQQKRREIAVLLTRPEWVLDDMGITRGDVHEALAKKGDPSIHLRETAASRRFWARKRKSL